MSHTAESDDHSDATTEGTSPPTAASLFRSTWWFLWGLLFPGVYLLFAAGFNEVYWQSGALSDYAILLHNWPCLVFVYPMVIFSAAGLGTVLWCPADSHRRTWVRFAVFSGVVVWFGLWIAWVFGVQGPFDRSTPFFVTLLCPLLGGAITLPFVGLVYGSQSLISPNRLGHDDDKKLLILGTCLLLFACTVPVIGIWFFALVSAAPLALVTYGWAATVCFMSIPKEDRRLSLKMAMMIVTWLSANFAAWRFAVNLMLAEYAALPTEPPDDCFIASAAAKGHSRFVGARCDTPINGQLRTLKAGELILRHTAPRLHRNIRTIYNEFGPRAARLLRNRWLADAAYLGLKPCEWFASLLLVIAKVPRRRVDTIYRSR